MKPLTLLMMMGFIAIGNIVDQPRIVAHRGFSGQAPENTLSAFRQAIDSGVQYLELDVHKSKDDSVIVIHDESIDRTCSNGMKGKVLEMTYDELSKVKVGYPDKFGDRYANEPLPTLHQALSLCKDKIRVCVEIKAHDVEEEVLKCIHQLEMEEQVIIFSFHKEVLQNIRKLDEDIQMLFLKTKASTSTISEAKELGAMAVGVGPLTNINKGFLQEARKHHIQVWRWTVNKEDKIKKFFEKGVDGIITNHPDVALRIRTEMNDN